MPRIFSGVAPHYGCQLGPGERVAQLCLSARTSDGGAFEQQGDGFTPLRVCAAVEFLAGDGHLFGKNRAEVAEVGRYGLQREIQQLAQLTGIAREVEADLRPPPRRNGLRDTVRIQHRLAQSTTDEVTGEEQILCVHWCGHSATGFLNIGGRPVQEVEKVYPP